MKLAYITNDSKRKTTYKKKTKGPVKKKKLPQSKQNNKMFNQESFLEQSIAKATQQLRKLRKENHQKELKKVMFQSLSGKGIF
ncbi:hypothetical protein PVK06_049401 [Gossypium arboreum]|uniref:Uncharacterized protein n=1 Tax=Gossypium arboreum TaxID=29729 RepID=A0ABR0MIJ4_GOSAR|nr:hypothetical protein PVK06_049401 [Gossypium arboreum]